MKTFKIILISGIISGSILAFFIILPVLVLKKSWWWFFVPLIFIGIIWSIISIILLVLKMKKKPPVGLKIDVKDAINKAVHEMKYDPDNPDNFFITRPSLNRIGKEGTEPTPILVIDGKGTEKDQRRTIIINMNNPKSETTKLIDASDEEIRKAVIEIAEHPPEEVKEETTYTTDNFGRPITTRTVSRPSVLQKKQEEEEKKAEEGNLM